jgi:hypothetical protein
MPAASFPARLRTRGARRASWILCGALLAIASAQCGSDSDGAVAALDTALTTPNGTSWIVLPRPPARVSKVFADSYVAPFVQAGSAVTVTPSTTTKSEGTTSLSVNLQTPTSEYAAAINSAEQTYDAASQTELTFAFNAGAAVNAGVSSLAVAVDDDDATTPLTYVTLQPYLTSGAVAANTWYTATIPMSALNPSARPIRRVLIANRSTLSNVTFLVDDIRLSWTDATPTERAVYTDTAGPSFLVGGWSESSAPDPFRTTGNNSLKATYTASWGALDLVYDWNLPEFPAGTFTTVSFDISPGTTLPAPISQLYIGLDSAPTRRLSDFVPGGLKANTWHRVTIRASDLVTGSYRHVCFKNESTSLYSFYVDQVRFQLDHAPPPLRTAPPPPPPPPPPPGTDPDLFVAGETDVVTIVRTALDRKPISPLIYGLNGVVTDGIPADVLRAATLLRRGGDRGNSYNWETNISNGSYNNNFANDASYAVGPSPNAPAAPDLANINRGRTDGRATMVPFVLNDYVSGPVASNIPWSTAGWNRSAYFRKVELVKPTPFLTTPDLNDGIVYTDEHMAFMKNQFATDIYAPGPSQVLVGIDNEPDLYHYNFPMLQTGLGAPIYASNGVQVGTRVTAEEFTARTIKFAKRAKEISASAHVIGPSHYHFDGFTAWHQWQDAQFQDKGHWYMDDFLASVSTASQQAGKRLLDTWDFHWYPQGVINGTYVWALDNASRTMTQAEIDAVVQGPRSYWDDTYDEQSWITSTDHLGAPANILNRLIPRVEAGYPGTKIGVTEYFPGGRSHISSGLAVADSLGVFARMGVNVAAMWPVYGGLGYAYGGLKLLRNADGNGLKFADTVVRVEHPEKVQTSVYAGADTTKRVTVLVVNKTNATRRVGVRAYNADKLTSVAMYRIDAAHQSPYLAATDAVTKYNAYAYAAPPMSATMLVFTAP